MPQICSSWNITSRMLQSYFPNSVIILLSFLWLPYVLQPPKQTFALWSYGDRFSVIKSITAYNYWSALSSLLHGCFSVVTQRSFRWKRLCSRLLFKRRENNFLLCPASLLRLLNAYFTLMHEWICHPPKNLTVVPWGLNFKKQSGN